MTDKPAFNFRIDPDLHARFKAACVLKRVKMSDVIEEMIVEYVEEKEIDATADPAEVELEDH